MGSEMCIRDSKRAASLIKTIGTHPEGGEVQLMNGRFGPYIKYIKNNISVKNKDKLDDLIKDHEKLRTAMDFERPVSVRRKELREKRKLEAGE